VVAVIKSSPDLVLNIVGAKPAGVTNKVAKELGREVAEAYKGKGRQVRLKGVRFNPSSKMSLGQGQFEVLASTVVEVEGQEGRPDRSEAVEAVVTIGRDKGQVLRTVKIPALNWTGQTPR